jgi:FkbM family methyltransferase
MRSTPQYFNQNQKDAAIKLLLSCAKRSNFIFDLGANTGTITRQLLECGVPVFAYEPDPLAFETLKNIRADNLTVLQSAVWINDKKVTLFRHKDWANSHSHTSSSLISTKKNVDNRNSVEVSAIDITTQVLQLRGNGCMKMDVEGAEYKLLNYWSDNGLLKRFDSIFCEFHGRKIRWGRIQHFLLFFKLLIRGENKIVKEWF